MKPNKTAQVLSILRDLQRSLENLIVLRDQTYVNWSVWARELWASGRIPDVYDPFTIVGTLASEIVQRMRPLGSLPQTVELPDRLFLYTGPVYVRPIGRGVVLSPDGRENNLSDLLSMLFTDGDYNVEITFRVLPREGE